MTGLIKGFFRSPLFTWWNSASVGTRLFTWRRGVMVGTDDQGNLYYREKKGRRRWVIYKNGPIEASRIPPEWHAWLHHTVADLPELALPAAKNWERPHVPNLTGTQNAYSPLGSLAKEGQRAASSSDYEAWRP